MSNDLNGTGTRCNSAGQALGCFCWDRLGRRLEEPLQPRRTSVPHYSSCRLPPGPNAIVDAHAAVTGPNQTESTRPRIGVQGCLQLLHTLDVTDQVLWNTFFLEVRKNVGRSGSNVPAHMAPEGSLGPVVQLVVVR